MAQSGKSFSNIDPQGIRRRVEGKELAPRSLRAKGKKWLNECSKTELEKARVV